MANLALLFVLTLTVPVASVNFRAASLTSLKLENEAGATPVAKVVTLLKDMQKQLEKEAEEDEVVYEKMVCW
jgi:hypothetical protein